MTPRADAEQLQRMRYRRALARKRRHARGRSEIRELNLTAMMDMMTLILVFLLKSYSASSLAPAAPDVRPPVSTTRQTPRDTVAVTITRNEILVGDRPVVKLAQGRIPPPLLQGRVVVPLDQALKQEVAKLKYIASRNPSPESAFHHELSVIADTAVPYDLLLTVLYTAGQNELENYRFVVLQKGEAPPPANPD